jgi:hypothetical protein
MDFIAGSVILAGAVTAWVSITRAQIDAVAFADRRQQARNACARALDDVSAESLDSVVSELGKSDKNGFALVRRFTVASLPSPGGEPCGRLEARPLRTESACGCYELRAVVRWNTLNGVEQTELSTVLGSNKP